MQITTVKIGELPDFVTGKLWKDLSPKPITALRAISQFHNPRAQPNDIALIFAHENNQLLALTGMLPDYIHGNPELSACSNSCWWADPEKGRHLALPLFLKAFSDCGQRMFMTDCTPHTYEILQQTKWFSFPEIKPGIRGFLKFNFHEILPQKFPRLKYLKWGLKIADTFFNTVLKPYQSFCRIKFQEKSLKAETVFQLDSNLSQFVEHHSSGEFSRRTVTDLNWILNYKWLTTNSTDASLAHLYPFSHLAKRFEQYFLIIHHNESLTGIAMISVRDQQMTVPHAYFEKDASRKILKVLYQEAIKKKVATLTIFHPELTATMQTESHPFIFRKKIKRMVVISKSLENDYQKYPVLQDGDGDIVFT